MLILFCLASELWDMSQYCHDRQLDYQNRGMIGRRDVIPAKSTVAQLLSKQPPAKRQKLENCIENNIAFFRAHYGDGKWFLQTLLFSIIHFASFTFGI